MPACAVANCNSTQRNQHKENVSYHKFPKDVKNSNVWGSKCKRKDYVDFKKPLYVPSTLSLKIF